MFTTHFMMFFAPQAATGLFPVSIDEAKAHLRVLDSVDDAYITALVGAAADKIERDTGLVLRAVQIAATYDGWVHEGRQRVPLWRYPVNSIGAVSYDAENGTPGALAGTDYRLREFAGLPYLVPGYDVQWPALEQIEGAVRVTYNAGFASNADVPPSVRHAALLLIGHWFENREAVNTDRTPAEVPLAYEALVRTFRLRMVV